MDISILFQKISRNLTWAPKHTHKKSDFQKFARVIEDSVNPKNDPLLKKNMKLAYLPNVKPCENKSIEIPKGINKIQVQDERNTEYMIKKIFKRSNSERITVKCCLLLARHLCRKYGKPIGQTEFIKGQPSKA